MVYNDFFATNLFGHWPLDRNTNDCQLILRNGLLWRTFLCLCMKRSVWKPCHIYKRFAELPGLNWLGGQYKPIDYWCLIDVLIALPGNQKFLLLDWPRPLGELRRNQQDFICRTILCQSELLIIAFDWVGLDKPAHLSFSCSLDLILISDETNI